MKKNSLKCSVLGLGLMLMMTGCGNSIPDMTEEQMQQVGEFAAITLLKYDANHRSRLVDPAVIEAADAKAESLKELQEQMYSSEKDTEGMNPVADTPTIEKEEGAASTTSSMSLEQVYGLPEGVTVSYKGSTACDSYPNDEASGDFFTLDATPGKKLLVLSFAIDNQSGSDQKVDLFSKTAVYRVTVNGSVTSNAMTTMLLDDMSTYVDTIPAGASSDVVLLVEIEESIAGNISSIALNLKNESKVCTIQLQ